MGRAWRGASLPFIAAHGVWGRGNGNGDDQRRRSNDRLQWQWDPGQWQLQWQWQWGGGVGGDVYVLLQGSMSCIVVDENVQNVWTATIREVGPANTGMIWSIFGCGPNDIYSGH
jgi:hypothetical protein